MPSRARSDFFFQFVSYGRNGPGLRDRLSASQIQQIGRTVGRTPEVMVKVLPKGATTLSAVRRHLDYIDRKGELELETDDGNLRGRDVGQDLVEDWDLDIDQQRPTSALRSRPAKSPPRLVHKLMFSMPPGTPPQKVLEAVRNLCREEFALKHRYAMALHTDEPHPHVHVVVKAISERGERLNLRNETLRRWREQFAQQLRALGVPANATPRYARGQTTPRKADGIYRASLRGESTHMQARIDAATQDLSRGGPRDELGGRKLRETRENVRRAWGEIGAALLNEGHQELSARVKRFVNEMPPPLTERAYMADKLLQRTRTIKSRDGPAR